MAKQGRENSFSNGLRLPELIRHMDHLMLSSEKKCLQDTVLIEDCHTDRKENSGTDQLVRDFGRKLCENSLSDDHLRTVLKVYQYHLHEANILQELEETCPHDSCKNKEQPVKGESRPQKLPKIQVPLRPTALLDRVLDKHKMKHEIVIPTMVLKDSSSNKSSRTSHKNARFSDRTEDNSGNKHLPHFNYAHGDGMGTRRNLPGQPELIRLLTDPEINLGKENVTHSNNDLNNQNPISLLSLYGGTMSPPLIEKQNQRRPRKRRIVCKFCRRPPGDHQTWCIYFDFVKINEEKTVTLSRSHTEDEIKLTKNTLTKIPELERSKTSMDDYMIRPDLPDYRPLHRDVYNRALADSRARLLMHRTQDFTNQLTKPFVFSYFSKLNGPKFRREKINGMTRIFGEEHTDFTQYYKLFVDSIKDGQQQ